MARAARLPGELDRSGAGTAASYPALSLHRRYGRGIQTAVKMREQPGGVGRHRDLLCDCRGYAGRAGQALA